MESTLPFEGVRIIDLSTVVMAPLATRMLGDMGADVIWVESPDGDVLRDVKPMRHDKMGAFALNVNRNKRSVVLDLKTDLGREALLDLIKTADVFVTNMRPQAIKKLRLQEQDIRAARADIIYCVANGFGSDGPNASQAAYDDVIQAASGTASMFAWHDDEPKLVPTIIADKVAGVHVAYAIAAALFSRQKTGKGCSLEIPMAETLAAFNLVEHLGGQTFRPQEGGFSYKRLRTPHRKPRRTIDGWMVILPYRVNDWRRFFAFSERGDCIDLIQSEPGRQSVGNPDELYALLDDIVSTKTTSEWLDFCAANSIPASEVLDLEHLAEDPHFAAVGLFQDAEHPTEGSIRYVRDPIKINGQNAAMHRHAPGHGENTKDVLSEIGWSSDKIDRLLQG